MIHEGKNYRGKIIAAQDIMAAARIFPGLVIPQEWVNNGETTPHKCSPVMKTFQVAQALEWPTSWRDSVT